MKDKQISFGAYLAIGFMLFALFFGAGNLIFPAQLGQYAGTNLLPAIIGFLITGVGLPLLGILAMGFSGSNNLQDLASRVHPIYGVFFTSLLYLTIGSFFATPRTGTVAYDIGISTFVSDEFQQSALLIFSFLFFLITALFSMYPARIVDNVGKILAPALVVLLVFLLITALVKPMGSIQPPEGAYATGAFAKGFLEGYNTMDAIASLVFGIIVINIVKSMGITSRLGILRATSKSGIIAIALLALIYVGIGYLGATSTSVLGLFDNGGPVLSGAADYYFGTVGLILLAIVIILACLTTAIGLITANAEYFHALLPKVGYKAFVIFFSSFSFVIANFGLTNIITYSLPVLMFLYPLAIVLMILTFVSPLFQHKRFVYVAATIITFLVSIIDGFKALCESLKIDYYNWLSPIIDFYETYLPLYKQGLGWLLPALIVIVITGIIARIQHSGATQEA
ncbi:branched-chain amino acid transport system II carrier protein [Oceanobacillus chungangensis]|uniref:Branched-chain amino acid transport system carrier protein n=1 Tax=Oceanobacillus chungangensis TaxID=1229152 RepID=A0A3D8PL48_9BACI|nr:branched-chain amino acid transport system II carrier protein [Oceanobacillus chungangensis]RDW16207.1 branched-chain amino acid transport system II carrier protein [Oceanobacillus chungangensis]